MLLLLLLIGMVHAKWNAAKFCTDMNVEECVAWVDASEYCTLEVKELTNHAYKIEADLRECLVNGRVTWRAIFRLVAWSDPDTPLINILLPYAIACACFAVTRHMQYKGTVFMTTYIVFRFFFAYLFGEYVIEGRKNPYTLD
jgi:hypothetical protein